MRYHLLDAIRGLALLGMILYHFCYDLTDIFNVSLKWFSGQGLLAKNQLLCFYYPFRHLCSFQPAFAQKRTDSLFVGSGYQPVYSAFYARAANTFRHFNLFRADDDSHCFSPAAASIQQKRATLLSRFGSRFISHILLCAARIFQFYLSTSADSRQLAQSKLFQQSAGF